MEQDFSFQAFGAPASAGRGSQQSPIGRCGRAGDPGPGGLPEDLRQTEMGTVSLVGNPPLEKAPWWRVDSEPLTNEIAHSTGSTCGWGLSGDRTGGLFVGGTD